MKCYEVLRSATKCCACHKAHFYFNFFNKKEGVSPFFIDFVFSIVFYVYVCAVYDV
jgi:hypothetical protein